MAKRVLIVEPNLRMLALSPARYAKVGIEIVTCDNAEQAIEILKQQKIDLIAPEAFMQNGDVFKFVKEVRALPEHSRTPIWVMARDPHQRGLEMAGIVGQTVRLLGADRFLIALPQDTPRLLRELLTLFNLKGYTTGSLSILSG